MEKDEDKEGSEDINKGNEQWKNDKRMAWKLQWRGHTTATKLQKWCIGGSDQGADESSRVAPTLEMLRSRKCVARSGICCFYFLLTSVPNGKILSAPFVGWNEEREELESNGFIWHS